jgi:hypothetical protein
MIAVLTGALDLTRMQPLELAHSGPPNGCGKRPLTRKSLRGKGVPKRL